MADRKLRYADVFLQLTRRHLLVFFKNKIRVLYTLLVPVIIFIVYILFLRELELGTVRNLLPQYGIALTEELECYLGALVDSWMLSGITAISVVTISLQTNNVIVEDKGSGVNRDFVSSPIPRGALIASYFFYNFIVTAAICAVFLVICGIYLACMGEFLLTFANVLTIFAVLLFTTVAATLLTVFIASFVTKEATMASIVAIFSTAIGFLIGAYMPFGMLPKGMRWVEDLCAFIPATHGCALMRYAFMETPLSRLVECLTANCVTNSAALPGLLDELTASFGYELSFFGTVVTPPWQAAVTAIFILLFLALNACSGRKLAEVFGIGKSKKQKKK